MTRWEYKWVSVETGGFFGPYEGRITEEMSAELDMLGREGWELVSVVPLAVGQGQTKSVVFYFKRPLE